MSNDRKSNYFDKDLNITMLTDFYELTMGGGYFHNGLKDTIGHFDLFYRHVPDNGGYVIAAGLEQMVDYLMNFCKYGDPNGTNLPAWIPGCKKALCLGEDATHMGNANMAKLIYIMATSKAVGE